LSRKSKGKKALKNIKRIDWSGRVSRPSPLSRAIKTADLVQNGRDGVTHCERKLRKSSNQVWHFPLYAS
jgi:hypothetical protein